jgi:hypothetical protein
VSSWVVWFRCTLTDGPLDVRRWARALTTLFAAAAAGLLLWFAPHFHRWTTGGYWGVIGLITVAGVLVGLSQLHGRDGNPLASFLVAFVPVLVAAGWVILADQPHGNWFRDHVLSWSGHMGIGRAVRNLGEHVAVLAFGLGIVFGVMFEPRMFRRGSEKIDAAPGGEPVVSSTTPVSADLAEQEPTMVEPPVADEPTAVEPRTPEQQAMSDEPVGEEPTVVESPAEQPRPDAEPTSERVALTGTPSDPADLTEDEPTVVAQSRLAEPAALPPLPRRFTQSWFVDNGPHLHSDQVPLLLAELRRRGWTQGEIEQRVIPHLQKWSGDAEASAPASPP